MKKLYPFLAILSLGFFTADAQFERPLKETKSLPGHTFTAPHSRAALPSGNQQVNAILWVDDFSVPSNWVMSHSAGPGDWVIGTNPPSGNAPIDPINSNTAANNFALYDSDLLCDTSQIADLTNGTAIDLTGHPNVRLKFSQYYRKFVDSTFVLVSNDSVNWTKYVINDDLNTYQYNEQHASRNPTEIELNISSVAGNQSTVWIRFRFYSPGLLGPAAGCAYAWMVDDVSIADIDSIDAKIAPVFAGEYTMIPWAQAQAVQLRGKVINHGLSAFSGAKIVFQILDLNFNQLYVDSSVASGNINAGDTSAYLAAANGPYAMPDTGLFYITHEIISPFDSTTDNNNDFNLFYVNDSTYARDLTAIDGDISNAYGFPTPTFNGGSFGQKYHIYQSSAVTSATFLISNATVGAQIRVGLFPVLGVAPQPTALGVSADYTITANDTLFNYMTLPFQSPISVTPGDYLVAITQLDTNFIGLCASTDIYTPATTYFRSTSPSWSNLDNSGFRLSFILRLNNPSSTIVGIPEAESEPLVYVYPNPTDGIVRILAADEKNVTINILNPLGQIIKTEHHDLLHSSQVDLSGYPAGIYTVNIRTTSRDINKTIILK